ncbi:MAG: N-acetyltransferase family protein [Thermoplasmatota archaeon]
MGVDIRQAREEEIDEIILLFDEGDLFHREGLPDVFIETDDPPWSKEYVLAHMRNPGSILYVAEDGSKIIGFAFAITWKTPDFPIFKHRVFASVENVYIKPEYRGSGLGLEMMYKLEDWAREKGFDTVQLNVWEFPGCASDFYKKMGYKTQSRIMKKTLD